MIYSTDPGTLKDLDCEMISNQELVHTPTSSQQSQYDPVFDYPTSSAISEAEFSSMASEPFSPARPYGLGLYFPSLETTECYTRDEQAWRMHHEDVHCTSTAPLSVPGLPIVDPQYLTNESTFGDQYHDVASLPGTSWNALHATFDGPSNIPSPTPSCYSMMSFYSPMQSPFAHSDSAVGLVASPYIKIEQPVETVLLSLNHHPAIKQSPQSSPRTPYCHVPEPVEERVAMLLTPSQISQPMEETTDIAFSTVSPTQPRIIASAGAQPHKPNRRKKRKYTTEANARLSCHVCGKLFQRKFNHRKHMETHQPFRVQPFVCEYKECHRSFGRRTDLARHEKSRHLQARDHVCPQCHAAFTRKDTLRRHVDDGCRLRFTVKQRSPKKDKKLISPVRISARSRI